MSDAVSVPPTDGKFSVGKMLAKTGASTATAGIAMTFSKWIAGTGLAWVEWFNRQPDYSVRIALPDEWATVGGCTLLVYAGLVIAQDVLRYYELWPRILD